jgi:hypothetical protein
MEMIVRSREKQVKSDRRCPHLQKNGETKGICVAKKTRGLAAWNSGHPSLFDTAIESVYFSKNGVLKLKINIFSG